MKRISDHREAGETSSGESRIDDDAVENVSEIERLVSDCQQPEHEGQDCTGDAADPLRQELDDLSMQVAETREELVQLRQANRALVNRLDSIEQPPEAFTSRPSLEALESIRQELGVAHELLDETRGKYDRAIADLISECGTGGPVLPATADHSIGHRFAAQNDAENRASQRQPVGWRMSCDSEPQPRCESDASRWARHQEAQTHRTSDGDSLAESAPDEVSRAEQQYSIWRHTQRSLADDSALDVDADRQDSASAASPESDLDSHWASKIDVAGEIESAQPDASDGATVEMSDDVRVSLWGKHAMRLSPATARAREADFSVESDQFLAEAESDSPTEMIAPFECTEPADVDQRIESQGDGASEDSINAYMDLLLRRVGADTDDSIHDAVSGLISQSSHLQQLVEENAEMLSSVECNDSTASMTPRSLPPEKRLGLTVMRDIANASARSAITRSVRKQTRAQRVEARRQFLYSGAAIICGVTLYFTVGQLPRLLAIALILMIAFCFAREGLLALLDARRRTKVAESCDAMTKSTESCNGSVQDGEDRVAENVEPAETTETSANVES
jgi:hypothetical protein